MASISVIGVPEDGCISLSSKAVNLVSGSRVVAGHPRHLEWFPQFQGTFLDMTQGFSVWLNHVLEESEEGSVAILASGDPLFYGIGSTLLKRLPRKEIDFIPSPSSAQLAFSRLGLPWQQAQFLSVHGRELNGIAARMQHGDLFSILTDCNNTPQRLAAHLYLFGHRHWTLHVCEQLGGIDEAIQSFSLLELAESTHEFHHLNLVVAQRAPASHSAHWGGLGQFADDESFCKRYPIKGLITKEPVRNLALTLLKIQPTDVVWDIGSGSGSIAIEAAKFASQGKVYAVECNPECFQAIEANCQTHGTDNVSLIKEKAPQGLTELSRPNAVFVGGSRGQMHSILSTAWQQLRPKGQLVVSAVTIDTVGEVYQWAKDKSLAIDAKLVSIAHLQPLAHYHRYQSENPIHLFTFYKHLPQNTMDVGQNGETQ